MSDKGTRAKGICSAIPIRHSIFIFAACGAILASAAVSSQTPFYPDKTNLLTYYDAAGQPQPIRSPQDWPRRRAHILGAMQQVMGDVPDDSRKVPLAVQITETDRTPTYTRYRLTYDSEPGDRVPAQLFLPVENGKPTRRPAILCLHQTTTFGKDEPSGLRATTRNLQYARELAVRGYVTLSPDYPGYGDYKIDPYAMGYVSATMKGIWNHMRAVDLLQSLPEVDPQRIGVIGHSLGGHNSLFVAAFDERIKVIVSSCGFNAFPRYYGGDLRGWSHKGYMPRIGERYSYDPKRMPFDFTEVLAALAPRPVFINAPLRDSNFEVTGVKDCVQAALPVYRLFRSADRLHAVHPDAAHDFPRDVREEAYEVLDRWLGRGVPSRMPRD